MRSKRIGTQSKFLRYIKCPLRALARARDLYMQSLAATGGGGGVTYGNAMGCPTPHISTLPSANSAFRSADEQLRDLMSLAHARAGRTEEELRRSMLLVRRSKSVAYGRIEEEKAFELGDDERMCLLGDQLQYHRSRSYAAPASTRLKFLP
ncbi:uncharacterized protein LOC131001833 [Salvia miltiorrhiza]|uniref:uncharacterized protein LOC131001833 n=1 Tax=Salvia miltiorrhiza TaxID=226208 RepID=UPI0025ABEE40|nr:uncharacterized protein LOC131001833 [Salvia miltiorrhiza]